MTFDFPLWLIVLIIGVEGWPVVLVAGVSLAILAALARGWMRWTAIVLLLPCAAILSTAAWWGIDARKKERETAAYYERINEVLDRDRVVSGIALPAGTAIQWTDADRVQLKSASPPEPLMVLGVRASWLSRADDGAGWDVQLPEPEQIDGWTCQTVGVRLSDTGRLLSCTLAAARPWQGWPIPANTLLNLRENKGRVGLVLPSGTSMMAPEIGHALTSTGGFSLNSDGSLHDFYFESDDPLVVAGMRLWNTVEWTYAPATLGQGRQRRALTLRGSLLPEADNGSETVTIRLSDGHVLGRE